MRNSHAFRVVAPLVLVAIGLLPQSVVAGVDLNAQQIVVANRGSGNLSVIDVASNDILTVPMPGGANTPDPMYFWYSAVNDLLFVGDRANNRVVSFNPRTYAVVSPNIPAGNGVFHMWGSPVTNRLWVVNDTARAVSVIDIVSQTNIGSFPTPNDLGPNAIPHDIVVEPNGSAAYVSIQGTSSATEDFVVKYSNAAGFPELDRQAVGKAPHVGFTPLNNLLYVTCQNSDRTDILNRTTLDPAAPSLVIDNSHGISPTEDGQTMYITSFPDGGGNDIHVVDPVTNTIVNSIAAPSLGLGSHNILTSPDDTRLYVTHTGGTQMSVFDITGANRLNPVFLTSLTLGTNPFAIGSVPVIPEPGAAALVATCLLGALRRRR